jgi:hypothetical protein
LAKKKHDWNNLQNYLAVHDSVLKKYAACFANNPRYVLTRPTEYMLELSTTMRFLHKNLKLEISKVAEVEVNGRNVEAAKTYSYTYAVSDDKGCLFRYCSAHPTHNKFHHKHVYDLITRQELKPPKKLDDEEVPHIDEVIDELLAL